MNLSLNFKEVFFLPQLFWCLWNDENIILFTCWRLAWLLCAAVCLCLFLLQSKVEHQIYGKSIRGIIWDDFHWEYWPFIWLCDCAYIEMDDWISCIDTIANEQFWAMRYQRTIFYCGNGAFLVRADDRVPGWKVNLRFHTGTQITINKCSV